MAGTNPYHGAAVIYSDLWECKEFLQEDICVRLVIVFLAGYANKENNGLVPWSQRQIANILSIGRRVIPRALDVCIKQGWVTVQDRKIYIGKEWRGKWDGAVTGKFVVNGQVTYRYSAIYPSDIWSDKKLLKMPSQRKYAWIRILCMAQYNWAMHGRRESKESMAYAFIKYSNVQQLSALVGVDRRQTCYVIKEIVANKWVVKKDRYLFLPKKQLKEWGSHYAISRKAVEAVSDPGCTKTKEDNEINSESARPQDAPKKQPSTPPGTRMDPGCTASTPGCTSRRRIHQQIQIVKCPPT